MITHVNITTVQILVLMPAVCSVCYHTFKHKYGLDQVGAANTANTNTNMYSKYSKTISYHPTKGPPCDWDGKYLMDPTRQEDELSEIRLCGALAGELGEAHGRGRWIIISILFIVIILTIF